MSIYDGWLKTDWDGEEYTKYPNSLKGIKIREDSTKHYPNQDENKLLRRLMSETGLTEEEIRNHKKYRRMLSQAATKNIRNQDNVDRRFKKIVKEVCRELKLKKEQHETIDEIKKYSGEGIATIKTLLRQMDREKRI